MIFCAQFGDCDPAGVVYFARYFDWAHRGYEAFLQERGTCLSTILAKKNYALPIVSCKADYKRSIHLGESVTWTLADVTFGKASYTLTHLFANSEEKAHIVTVHACVELPQKVVRAVPDEIKFALCSKRA